jgi:hypothetical protein
MPAAALHAQIGIAAVIDKFGATAPDAGVNAPTQVEVREISAPAQAEPAGLVRTEQPAGVLDHFAAARNVFEGKDTEAMNTGPADSQAVL